MLWTKTVSYDKLGDYNVPINNSQQKVVAKIVLSSSLATNQSCNGVLALPTSGNMNDNSKQIRRLTSKEMVERR